MLQYIADLVAELADVVVFNSFAVQVNIAVGRFDERVNHAQGGGFAAARAAHQHEKLALINGQIQIAHGIFAVILLACATKFDKGDGFVLHGCDSCIKQADFWFAGCLKAEL